MEVFIEYLKVFAVGGLFCLVAQILIDKTSLTPAKILVAYVCAGVVLYGVGLYKPISDFAGAGASVPLTGFGALLASGVKKAVDGLGIVGAFTGGLGAAAGGICAAISFSVIFALFFRSKADK